MSTADESDFTVPDDETELLAELRRRGVRPGRRLHISVVDEETAAPTDRARLARRRLGFVGLIHAEPDLSEKTDEYLRGFGLG